MKKILVYIPASLMLVFALACGSSAADEIRQRAELAAARGGASTSEGPDGLAIYRKYCVNCHGANGKLGLSGAKDLTKSALTLEERAVLIRKGKGLMTPFGELLNDEEIAAVAAYTLTLRK
ncbi:MAG: c-type cytochrome [Saprospiraceae bacterium]